MITLTLIVIVLIALYWYGTRTFRYWEQRGVKHDKPVLIFGTNKSGFLLQKSITETLVDCYWKYPQEKIVGMFRSTRPELLIRDPEIAKQILINNFGNFYPRGLNRKGTTVEPILKNLFFVDGDVWRLLRQRMTPAFTSGKLKAMFPLIVERAERLQARVLQAPATPVNAHHRALDARDLMARYTTDFIGAVGFGLDANSLNDDDSNFRKLGVKIFSPTAMDIFQAILKELLPVIFVKDMKLMAEVEKEMTEMVAEILKQRNYEPCGRNDFIDLLLECKKKGLIEGDSIERIKPDGTPEHATLEMNESLLVAQVFVFFAAGFETSSSATSFTLHQLAYNQEVQKKVQQEIHTVLAKHENKLSYDAINEMHYLGWAFKEGMRMFPSLGFLIRECVHKYTLPDVNVTIDEGIRVFIPLQAMQNDPKYFDNPHEFKPERFNPEEFDKWNKHVYMPFGDGPRACIGERLGLMQSLAGLAAVLSRFTVHPVPNTKRDLQIEPKSGIVQTVKGGIPLIFEERTFSL